MALIFTQEDTNGTCALGQYCSTDASTPESRKQCEVGGTAGSTPVTVTLVKNAMTNNKIQFECIVGTGKNWGAGNWTIRLNITTANSNITWTGTFICRINSSCVSQETIGSLTGQTTSLGTTGVKTHTVSGSAVTPGAGDKVMVILRFTNSDNMNSQAFGYTPNQNIDAPFAVLNSVTVQDAVSVSSGGDLGVFRQQLAPCLPPLNSSYGGPYEV